MSYLDERNSFPEGGDKTIQDRYEKYRAIEKSRETKIITYFGNPSPLAGIRSAVSPFHVDKIQPHLDAVTLRRTKKISLFICTNGGDANVPWTLVNLIRSYCREFELIIPSNCRSAGTMIALGADRVVMTKGATLGPVDSTIYRPLNPRPDQGAAPVPIQVESLASYLDMARETLAIKDDKSLSGILNNLAGHVHPLVIGDAYRQIKQSKMLANKLLSTSHRRLDEKKKEELVNFLVSESGDHSYTIGRDEAKKLGLNVEKPDDALYKQIKGLYDSILEQLNPKPEEKENKMTVYPVLIESVGYGSDGYFIQSGEKGGQIRGTDGWHKYRAERRDLS